jgi:hypothetical protein
MRSFIKYSGLFFLMAAVALSFNSCHLLRKQVSGRGTLTEDENLIKKAYTIQPEWRFMEMRLSGKADEDGDKFSFMGTVKLERNQQIFVILRSTIGFELARVYANKDSVWISSKMLGFKEKGDWKLVGKKVGYPVDFNAMQGILTQALFTSKGDQLSDLLVSLTVKNEDNFTKLVSNTAARQDLNGNKYLNEFWLNKNSYLLQQTKISDIKGQWIAEVNFLYGKDEVIKRIELKGIDSERNFALDVNVTRRDIKDILDFNFDKF